MLRQAGKRSKGKSKGWIMGHLEFLKLMFDGDGGTRTAPPSPSNIFWICSGYYPGSQSLSSFSPRWSFSRVSLKLPLFSGKEQEIHEQFPRPTHLLRCRSEHGQKSLSLLFFISLKAGWSCRRWITSLRLKFSYSLFGKCRGYEAIHNKQAKKEVDADGYPQQDER